MPGPIPLTRWPAVPASDLSCPECLEADDGTGDTEADWWTWRPDLLQWVPYCERHAIEWNEHGDALIEYFWTDMSGRERTMADLPDLSGLPRQSA